MDSDVLQIVSGQPLASMKMQAATAPGYVQREVAGESFPVLHADSPGCATGVLIHGLTETAIQRILFFEGEEYQLRALDIVTADGIRINARYFADAAVYQLLPTSWSFEHWLAHEKNAFIARCRRYMDLFGTLSIAEADTYW